jgi:Ca2+-binding RTX toxin-like protein
MRFMQKPIRIALVLGALTLALASAQTVSANHVECFGRNVPHTNVGGPGNNDFTGTDQADVFYGGAGRDTIRGLSGPDRLCGGPDKDLIFGGRGSDRINGQRGNDGEDTPRAELLGGPGDDKVMGGRGGDFVKLGAGSDTGRGNSGDDQVGSFDKVQGNDIVDGGSEVEADICGGDMNDKFLDCEAFE